MLYITTRDNKDAHTIHKTLLNDLAPDGGVFVPFRLPVYTQEEILELRECGAGEIIANILNRFFCVGITGRAVEFAIGRNCIKTAALSQKIIVIEPWHNPLETYRYTTECLYRLLSDSKAISKQPTNWVKIAIRIAILFAVYCDMAQNGQIAEGDTFDLAVNVNDFSIPMAGWYAMQMGLPINVIICSCADNDGVWDLIHRGQINLNAVTAELASGLERLIYSVYGEAETARFIKTAEEKKTYAIDPETEIRLNDTFFCAVAGEARAATVINSAKRTDGYTFCASGALAYGAIQDYRAKAGESKLTVLFSDDAPEK